MLVAWLQLPPGSVPRSTVTRAAVGALNGAEATATGLTGAELNRRPSERELLSERKLSDDLQVDTGGAAAADDQSVACLAKSPAVPLDPTMSPAALMP